jgi:hypothetical protein
MIGLHSLLEYPLWYAYFLLPAAWALGFALQGESEPSGAPDAPHAAASPALGWAGLALMAGAAFSVVDYVRVAAIFSATSGAGPLEQRIASGQHSVFFAHHADYAAATSGAAVPDPKHAFDRATHYLLDTRLMMAWARSLAAQGDIDAARHLAARLREFRNADATEFFEDCPDAAAPAGSTAGAPFQCELPVRSMAWRDFVPPR